MPRNWKPNRIYLGANLSGWLPSPSGIGPPPRHQPARRGSFFLGIKSLVGTRPSIGDIAPMAEGHCDRPTILDWDLENDFSSSNSWLRISGAQGPQCSGLSRPLRIGLRKSFCGLVVIHGGGSMITDIAIGIVLFNYATALWALPFLTLQSPAQALALSMTRSGPDAD